MGLPSTHVGRTGAPSAVFDPHAKDLQPVRSPPLCRVLQRAAERRARDRARQALISIGWSSVNVVDEMMCAPGRPAGAVPHTTR
jgi:hypothetical protein